MLDKIDGKLISTVLFFRLEVLASQETKIVVQGANPNITQQTAEQIHSLVDEHLATSKNYLSTLFILKQGEKNRPVFNLR